MRHKRTLSTRRSSHSFTVAPIVPLQTYSAQTDSPPTFFARLASNPCFARLGLVCKLFNSVPTAENGGILYPFRVEVSQPCRDCRKKFRDISETGIARASGNSLDTGKPTLQRKVDVVKCKRCFTIASKATTYDESFPPSHDGIICKRVRQLYGWW